MSRVSEFRHKYGVFGAGAVSRSLIGSLAAQSRDVGPVAAVSFRVASRLTNTLHGGYAVRDAAELKTAGVILFHAPPEHVDSQLAILREADLDWTGRSLILCHCYAAPEVVALFEEKGAAVATIRDFGVAGFVALHGSGEAMKAAIRISHVLHLRTVEILADRDRQFDAGVTLATAAITPLIDQAAFLLRTAGAKEGDASRLAAALVEHTARGYSHSGRQSWAWHIQKPDALRLEQQIAECGEPFSHLFRTLLLLGFDLFERHKEATRIIRDGPAAIEAAPKSTKASK